MIQVPADYNYPSVEAVKLAAGISPWIYRGLTIFITLIIITVMIIYLKRKAA